MRINKREQKQPWRSMSRLKLVLEIRAGSLGRVGYQSAQGVLRQLLTERIF
jgi:hypothetical protein